MTRDAGVGCRGWLLGQVSRPNSSMRLRIVLKSLAAQRAISYLIPFEPRTKQMRVASPQPDRGLGCARTFHRLVEAVGAGGRVAAPAAFAHDNSARSRAKPRGSLSRRRDWWAGRAALRAASAGLNLLLQRVKERIL